MDSSAATPTTANVEQLNNQDPPPNPCEPDQPMDTSKSGSEPLGEQSSSEQPTSVAVSVKSDTLTPGVGGDSASAAAPNESLSSMAAPSESVSVDSSSITPVPGSAAPASSIDNVPTATVEPPISTLTSSSSASEASVLDKVSEGETPSMEVKSSEPSSNRETLVVKEESSSSITAPVVTGDSVPPPQPTANTSESATSRQEETSLSKPSESEVQSMETNQNEQPIKTEPGLGMYYFHYPKQLLNHYLFSVINQFCCHLPQVTVNLKNLVHQQPMAP